MIEAFQILALVYVGVGVWTLVRFVRGWGALFDDHLTEADMHLARRVGFFVFVPFAVALHELGHAVTIHAYGLRVVDWQFLGYMGWVAPSGSAGPLGDFAIALAGNLVTVIVGIGAFVFGLAVPGHAARNIIAFELGWQALFLTLVFYPLICLAFAGDWQIIYDFSATPIASATTAVVHALLLGVGYSYLYRRRWRGRLRVLSSAWAARFIEADARWRRDAGDIGARRELGVALVTAGADEEGASHLQAVVEAGAADARVQLLLGVALVNLGRGAAATSHLEVARDRSLRPEDRRIAEEALTRARV